MIKHLSLFFFFVLALTMTNCEIVQETTFTAEGNGRYSLGFDLSEMMKMGNANKDSSSQKQLDTLFVFSEFLALKKDSISKLNKADRKKIKELEDFSLYVKTDTVMKRFEMKLNYDFKNIADLKLFSNKIRDQKVKELEMFTKQLNKSKNNGDNGADIHDVFDMEFNRDKFTVKASPKALANAESQKDTTMTEDNPMVNLIKFKARFLFPYRIKRISNEHARIMSDFKGIEITANLFEINNDPKFFDVDVEFENE